VVDRLAKKHSAAARHMPAPVLEEREGATIGVVCVGSCEPAVKEALELLAEAGVVADFMRIRAFPFADVVREFIEGHERCFVVEQNRDAQLRSLLCIEAHASGEKLRSILAYGGFPLSARQVIEGITSQMEER
jgi:2-oxoglutarate ferredoxin oxidoreductase subunit alpha